MTDSAPIPTNHVHETGRVRPVFTARRDDQGSVIINDSDGVMAHSYPPSVSAENLRKTEEYFLRAAAQARAALDLLLREQEDESALVDELVLAAWGSIDQVVGLLADSTADHRRQVVRRFLAAQKKRAES